MSDGYRLHGKYSDVASSVIGVCQNDRKSSVLACNLFRFAKLSSFHSPSICSVIKKMYRLSALRKSPSRSYEKNQGGKYETIGWKVLDYLRRPCCYYNVGLSHNIIFKGPTDYQKIPIRNIRVVSYNVLIILCLCVKKKKK